MPNNDNINTPELPNQHNTEETRYQRTEILDLSSVLEAARVMRIQGRRPEIYNASIGSSVAYSTTNTNYTERSQFSPHPQTISDFSHSNILGRKIYIRKNGNKISEGNLKYDPLNNEYYLEFSEITSVYKTIDSVF
jgi:hypothetical protein